MTLGVLNDAKMAENLDRHGGCVINLPSPAMWQRVEKLAPLTGKNPVPEEKAKQFQAEKDKFAAAGLTRLESEIMQPMRVRECPIQMEAKILSMHELGGRKVDDLGGGRAVVVEALRVHADETYVIEESGHVDPDKWSPPTIFEDITSPATCG